jgi:hypothetical protein
MHSYCQVYYPIVEIQVDTGLTYRSTRARVILSQRVWGWGWRIYQCAQELEVVQLWTSSNFGHLVIFSDPVNRDHEKPYFIHIQCMYTHTTWWTYLLTYHTVNKNSIVFKKRAVRGGSWDRIKFQINSVTHYKFLPKTPNEDESISEVKSKYNITSLKYKIISLDFKEEHGELSYCFQPTALADSKVIEYEKVWQEWRKPISRIPG